MSRAAIRPEPGAGHPFLAFLNTVTDDGKTRRINSFQNPSVLVKLLEDEGYQAPAQPLEDAQFTKILKLRETAYAVCSALAAEQTPGREDVLTLTTALRRVYQDAEMTFDATGLSVGPSPIFGLYEQLVLSMDDLMRANQFGRLRECRRCTHLFLDQGRGVGRRWCSMSRCGNRAKAESFRARQKSAA